MHRLQQLARYYSNSLHSTTVYKMKKKLCFSKACVDLLLKCLANPLDGLLHLCFSTTFNCTTTSSVNFYNLLTVFTEKFKLRSF
uniref:Ovule protein n=1 Tax=Ditylenchus dipsaci TaxID=166011 RepID=A0A915D7A5_9BILA